MDHELRDTRHVYKLTHAHRHKNKSYLKSQIQDEERHLPDHHLVRNPKHGERRLTVDKSEKIRRNDVLQHWEEKNKTESSRNKEKHDQRVDLLWREWRAKTKQRNEIYNRHIANRQKEREHHRHMLHMQHYALNKRVPEDISNMIQNHTRHGGWPGEHTDGQLKNSYFV